jgi:hypothetical protein
LEEGTFLHWPLLQSLLDAVSSFVHDCGLVRYNRFALPLLMFVRKCVGVGPEEFEGMVDAARLRQVLYVDGGDPAAAGGGCGTAAAASAAAQQQPGRRSGGGVVAEPSAASVASDATGAGAAAKPRVPRLGGAAAPPAGKAAPRASSSSGAGPPIAPIDFALAVANKQIGEAIASARSELSAAASSGGGRAARVRGLARGATPKAAAPGADYCCGGGGEAGPLGDGAVGLGGGQLGGEAAEGDGADGAAEGADAEPLIDLGLEEEGGSLPSRRLRVQRADETEWSVPPSARDGGSDDDS